VESKVALAAASLSRQGVRFEAAGGKRERGSFLLALDRRRRTGGDRNSLGEARACVCLGGGMCGVGGCVGKEVVAAFDDRAVCSFALALLLLLLSPSSSPPSALASASLSLFRSHRVFSPHPSFYSLDPLEPFPRYGGRQHRRCCGHRSPREVPARAVSRPKKLTPLPSRDTHPQAEKEVPRLQLIPSAFDKSPKFEKQRWRPLPPRPRPARRRCVLFATPPPPLKPALQPPSAPLLLNTARAQAASVYLSRPGLARSSQMTLDRRRPGRTVQALTRERQSRRRCRRPRRRSSHAPPLAPRNPPK
jgi:hypothetical protein